jgi:hypothetical protein
VDKLDQNLKEFFKNIPDNVEVVVRNDEEQIKIIA